MEKKTISVHAVTIHAYMIAIVLLAVALIALGVKYVHLRLSVHDFTESTMFLNEMQNHMPVSSVTDYATILATTIASFPSATPLMTEKDGLQNYVSAVSKNVKRDIVVVDTTEKILADTLPSNRGNVYAYDKQNEVGMTLKDGISRSFTETSADYPQGMSEVVAAVKNTNNEVIGAVIVSNFPLSK